MSQRNCKILTLIHPPWWTRKGPIGAINMGIVKSPKVSYKGRTEAKIDTPIKPLVSSNHWMPKSHLCEVHAFTSFKYCFAHRFARSSRGWSFCSSAESSFHFWVANFQKWIFQSAGVFNIIPDNFTKCGCQGPPPKPAAAFLGLIPPGKRVGKVIRVRIFTPFFILGCLSLLALPLLGFLFAISLSLLLLHLFLCLSASLRLSLRSSCFLGASLYFRFRGSFSLGRTTFFLWGTLLSLFRFPGLGCRSLHPRIQGFLHLLLLASVHLHLQGFLFSKAIRVMLW